MGIFALGIRRVRGLSVFVLVLLVIEFVDEFAFGAYESALPLIRDDLNLGYEQIGLLLALPPLIANIFFEPIIGVLGDVWKRRVLVIGGGIGFALSAVMTATSQNFWFLLLSIIVFNPSSGAFVGLAQSTLMDIEPDKHEKNMARWTFAGSLGVLVGALTLVVLLRLGFGWRSFYWLLAIVTVITLLVLVRLPFPKNGTHSFRAPRRSSLFL